MQVTYDHSQKLYTTGDGTTFPSGEQGKANAVEYCVLLLNPALHSLCNGLCGDYPHASREIWKAAELVLMEHVCVPAPDGLATVMASDQSGHYQIENEGAYVTCTCPAFGYFIAPWILTKDDRIQAVCKHILAYKLQEKLSLRD